MLAGGAAIAIAMVAGRVDLPGLLLTPPLAARLLLAAAAALVTIVVVLRATARLADAGGDARELIRAVRLIFLAVGIAAVAAGWLVGSPVPVVAGLVIIGIDLLETTFLLVVATTREHTNAPIEASRND